MVITLIGHSGCGKSHLAKRLEAERGFTRFCCDDLIEKHLSADLKSAGLSSIRGVAEWLGQPYEPQFEENQGKYHESEIAVMKDLLRYISHEVDHLQENVVIDTSGSVIYVGDDILKGFRDHSRLIYLAVPECEYEFMYRQYFSSPKPVIWGDRFEKLDQESNEEALRRCYPELIRYRAELYQKHSDVMMVIDRDNRDAYSVTRLLRLADARSQ